jgi:sialidase-1
MLLATRFPAVGANARTSALNSAATTAKPGCTSKTLEAGPSAYSDLAVLPDGVVVCLYEGNKTITAARFNLEWVQQP